MDPRQKVMRALDVPTLDEAYWCIDELSPYVGGFKIGLESIVQDYGKSLIERIHQGEHTIFYDGKFHDIPRTVLAAAKAITRLNIDMFTVHRGQAVGSIRAALEGAKIACEANPILRAPKVLAVSLLTSESSRSDYTLYQINSMAIEAQHAGAHGVIASRTETEIIRQSCGNNFMIIVAGIRLPGDTSHDHWSACTPGEAVRAGATYIVVGRTVLDQQRDKRVDAIKRVLEDISS